jgi:hypothetical protein
MTDKAITVAGIEIPFSFADLLDDRGVPRPGGIGVCPDGAGCDVDQEASRIASDVWDYLLLVSLGSLCFRDHPHGDALG